MALPGAAFDPAGPHLFPASPAPQPKTQPDPPGGLRCGWRAHRRRVVLRRGGEGVKTVQRARWAGRADAAAGRHHGGPAQRWPGRRASHLDIRHCRVGVVNKRAGLEELRHELAMGREQTAFLGDDLNDLVVREATGLLITPADAAPGLRRQADWILRRRGGDGALREFSDALLASQGWMEGFESSGVGTTN